MTDAFAPRPQDIDDKFVQTAALIETARRRSGGGAIVDLSGLEACIRELCEAAKAAPNQDTDIVGQRIVSLRNDLQALGDELSARHQALVGRVEAAKRQPAIKAYGKATGDT
jgi:hypothetical protein